jgi:hypothetical protein
MEMRVSGDYMMAAGRKYPILVFLTFADSTLGNGRNE